MSVIMEIIILVSCLVLSINLFPKNIKNNGTRFIEAVQYLLQRELKDN